DEGAGVAAGQVGRPGLGRLSHRRGAPGPVRRRRLLGLLLDRAPPRHRPRYRDEVNGARAWGARASDVINARSLSVLGAASPRSMWSTMVSRSVAAKSRGRSARARSAR